MLVVAITNGSDDHTPDHHSSSDAQHTGPSIGRGHPRTPYLSPSPQPARSAQPSSLRSTHGVVISLVAEPHLGRYGLGGPYQWPTPFDTIRHPINTLALLSCRRARRGYHRRRHRRTACPVRTLTPPHTARRTCLWPRARWKMMRNILSLLNPVLMRNILMMPSTSVDKRI